MLGMLQLCMAADDNQKLYTEAQNNYKNKNYQEAVNSYISLINKGFCNSDLFYNAGNAYFKNKQLGWAIWCYEKSLKQCNSNEDACINLKISNLKIVDKIEPLPQLGIITMYHNFLSSSNAAFLNVLAIIASILFLALMILYIKYFRTKFYLFIIALLILVISFVFHFLAWQSNSFKNDHLFAIVTDSNCEINSAPNNSGAELFVLHEGTKIEVIEQQMNYSKIKLIDGKQGWVSNTSINTI